MLSYIRLKNFKSFSDIYVNFNGTHEHPKKLIAIYGENGAGKTNLMQAISFLTQTIETLAYPDKFGSREALDKLINDKDVPPEIIQMIFDSTFLSIEKMYDRYKMIGSDEEMELEFGFIIEGHDGMYRLKIENGIVSEEQLEFLVRSRRGMYFNISSNSMWLSPSVFVERQYKTEIEEQIDKYWGKHTFLAILFKELKEKNHSYFINQLGENLDKFFDWLKSLTVWCKGFTSEMAHITVPFRMMSSLDKGKINQSLGYELEICEHALNSFFTSLYSDIKAVSYHKELVDGKISYELFVTKQIDGRYIEISISQESAGTRKLLQIFPVFFASYMGKTVAIDEIDNGIHDRLIVDVLKEISNHLSGQLIITTHNTLLMKTISPESMYVIREDFEGKKEVCTLAELGGKKYQEEYLRGDFGGIPCLGDFDFEEISNDIVEALNSNKVTETGDRFEENN